MGSGTVYFDGDVDNAGWGIYYAGSLWQVLHPAYHPATSYLYTPQPSGDRVYFTVSLENIPIPAGEGLSYIALFLTDYSADNGIPLGISLLDGSNNTLASVYSGWSLGWTPSSLVLPSIANALRMRVFYNSNGNGNYISRVAGAYVTWQSAPYPAHTVAIGEPTNKTPNAARLNGTLTADGYPVQYWFEYGLTTAYGSTTAVGSSSGAPVSPVADLVGLSPGTIYHARLAVRDVSTGNMVYSPDKQFSTLAGLVALV